MGLSSATARYQEENAGIQGLVKANQAQRGREIVFGQIFFVVFLHGNESITAIKTVYFP